MTLDQLKAGVGEAVLDTGTPTSPGQVRRLACDASIIPLVLDGDFAILAWAWHSACSAAINVWSSRCVTEVASGRVVTDLRYGAKPITSARGTPAGQPTWPTPACSAPTIIWCTAPTAGESTWLVMVSRKSSRRYDSTRPTLPDATSASPDDERSPR